MTYKIDYKWLNNEQNNLNLKQWLCRATSTDYVNVWTSLILENDHVVKIKNQQNISKVINTILIFLKNLKHTQVSRTLNNNQTPDLCVELYKNRTITATLQHNIGPFNQHETDSDPESTQTNLREIDRWCYPVRIHGWCKDDFDSDFASFTVFRWDCIVSFFLPLST